MSRVPVRVGRLLAAAAVAVSALLVPAAHADPDLRGFRALTSARATGLATLYAGRPATVADYVSALTRFRAGVEQGLFAQASPIMPLADPPPFVPYLWGTEDGSTIRKLGDGSFVVVQSRLLDNFHTETRCYGADWPNFFCGDDQARTMIAPDLWTVIFDGVEYSRAMPRVDVDPDSEADGEAASVE